MTNFEFQDAAPVKRAILGRAADPNPFVDLIKSIANVIDPKTGEAQAKSFLVDKPKTDDKDDPARVAIRKYERQIGFAGPLAEATPPVSALKHVDYEPREVGKDGKPGKVIPGKVRITVWTGPKQERKRKPAEITEPVATDAK